MEAAIPDSIKKNILDLQYNKYLQYHNTAIIILFTYFIGVGIGFITKQIDTSDPAQLLTVAGISSLALVLILLSMLRFLKHQKNILKEIRKLHV